MNRKKIEEKLSKFGDNNEILIKVGESKINIYTETIESAAKVVVI